MTGVQTCGSSDLDPGSGGEIQITDAMIRLMQSQEFYGLKFDGTTYDCGDKIGFLAANVAFALEREDLGPAFRLALQHIIAKHNGFLSWNANSELASILKDIKSGYLAQDEPEAPRLEKQA